MLSGAGERERSLQSLESLYSRLVKHKAGLIQLFDPPFDTSELNLGYVKGYVPGVRENGGQHTHKKQLSQYRGHSKFMLKQFANSADPATVDRVGKSAMLLADARS